MEKDIENLEKRVEKLEQIFETVNTLTVQIEKLALETKYSREDLNKVIKRVDELEHKPEKRWETVVTSIMTGIIGAIIGAVVALLKK